MRGTASVNTTLPSAALLGYRHNGKSNPPKTPTDPFGIAPGISSAVEDDPHEVIIAESRREFVVYFVLVAGNDDEPARSRLRLPSRGRHPERKNTLARNPSALLSWAVTRITEQRAHVAMRGRAASVSAAFRASCGVTRPSAKSP
jgi:hypothetical protein